MMERSTVKQRRKRFLSLLLSLAFVWQLLPGTVLAATFSFDAEDENALPKGTILTAGDVLSGIGPRFGVTVAQIQQWNNIKNPNVISAGQKLTIYPTVIR